MEKFKRKESAILSAIQKVQAKLKLYSEKFNSLGVACLDWNDLHDLEYRLNQRLKDNYSNYCEWHYNTYGWVAI